MKVRDVFNYQTYFLMRKITRRKRSEAKVCKDKTCVTVYDEAAEFVNGLVVISASIVAAALIVRAIR
ncbi:MAG: hypothetical protein Salg2KO_04200 [Salibacteraceae bacterium]